MTQRLYKRGKTYHYRFELNGVSYTGSTKARDLETAKQVLEVVRRDCVLGDHGIRKAPTLGAVIGAWLETRGKSASDEHRIAAEKAKEALKPLVQLPLTYVTTARVEAWRSAYLQGRSPATVNLVMRYLKLFCRWALKDRQIKEMPYSVKMLKEEEKARPIVEKGQREAFLQAVTRLNPQIPAAATFAMTLGVREAEMLNAHWEWLTEDKYDVRSRTKGKKHREIATAPILYTALGWMLAHQALARKEPLPVRRPDLGLIFPGDGGKPHVRGWLNKALKRGATAIGVPTLGIHRLRATFATLHLRNKAPLKEVQTMLGHQNAMTTLRYQEVSLEEQTILQRDLWA